MCADTGTVPEQGDAQELPFEDRSFDAATMGYGLRNVADKPRALAELRRVLRPGCRAAILVGGVLNGSGALLQSRCQATGACVTRSCNLHRISTTPGRTQLSTRFR